MSLFRRGNRGNDDMVAQALGALPGAMHAPKATQEPVARQDRDPIARMKQARAQQLLEEAYRQPPQGPERR
jgi:hypothetical protein